MRIRGWLLAASLIGSLVVPATAAAQPSHGAQPTGGTVVAGSASIGAPTAGGVVIKQSSPRAAINWTASTSDRASPSRSKLRVRPR